MSAVPHRKAAAAGVSGAVATIVVWVLAQSGLNVPGEVGAAIAAVLAFVASYLRSA